MSLSQEIDFSPAKGKKNLLAFSAGIDSSALFFLLLEQHIDFDIAIVNYNLRASSSDEAAYAKELCVKHDKKLYYLETHLKGSAIEEEARKIRFDFFESIIKEEGYDNLLTAHQLNDQMEWFLMQLTKGAGSLELLGMQTITLRQNYTLYKPLLKVTKEQLQDYLDQQNLTYFIDLSNSDQNYKRNYFRHNFSDALIKEYQEGITRSFDYIQQDNQRLLESSQVLNLGQLTVIQAAHHRSQLYHIDKALKKRAYILSHAQRQEIQKSSSVVISDAFVIEQANGLTYISPFIECVMDKDFKEGCRMAKIPHKIRPFLYKFYPDIKLLQEKISEWQS